MVRRGRGCGSGTTLALTCADALQGRCRGAAVLVFLLIVGTVGAALYLGLCAVSPTAGAADAAGSAGSAAAAAGSCETADPATAPGALRLGARLLAAGRQ